ncbi:MAG: ribonuclease H-like domain-containing protein [Patescibacteria group bacterium]|nr:ribonuclease H-like domain-containing protein [Patescibacteria group bacterium]MDE1941007.1 ribonuclease H-like domain-containing protein [Patescibacteria group bacterium]MDE1966470.1 ribonuclease H-like domain-containing protein [Patescibacteria group bacterium]
MRKITFDLETKNFFHDVGSNDPADLDISVVCIHDSADGSYRSFLEPEFGKLWPILEEADMLVTWNGDHFDIPLLNKYYPGDLTKIKSLDLMKEAAKALGRRLKLDTVAEATLGVGKNGLGADALVLWQNGEIDKLIDYCMNDVKLTKELYEYAVANKSLKYKEFGAVKEIKLDTASWEIPAFAAMTYTLPF